MRNCKGLKPQPAPKNQPSLFGEKKGQTLGMPLFSGVPPRVMESNFKQTREIYQPRIIKNVF